MKERSAIVWFILMLWPAPAVCQDAYIRVNQAGYQSGDRKAAIAFSSKPLADEAFLVRNSSGSIVWSGRVKPIEPPAWGPAFSNYYELDFSSMSAEPPGRHSIQLVKAGVVSRDFAIAQYPGISRRPAFFHAAAAVRLQPVSRHGLSPTRRAFVLRPDARRIVCRCKRRVARCRRSVEVSDNSKQRDGTDDVGV